MVLDMIRGIGSTYRVGTGTRGKRRAKGGTFFFNFMISIAS